MRRVSRVVSHLAGGCSGRSDQAYSRLPIKDPGSSMVSGCIGGTAPSHLAQHGMCADRAWGSGTARNSLGQPTSSCTIVRDT